MHRLSTGFRTVAPRGAPHAGNLAVEAQGLEVIASDEILIANWLSQGRAADCQNLTTKAPAPERIDLREMRVEHGGGGGRNKNYRIWWQHPKMWPTESSLGPSTSCRRATLGGQNARRSPSSSPRQQGEKARKLKLLSETCP